MLRQEKHLYAFGPFHVDSANRFLLRDGKPLPLTPKAFDILLLLVENHGQVMEKDRIMQAVWPDTFVEEANLTQHVSTLRKALGESPEQHDFIETIPRRGYRFVAPVQEIAAPPESPQHVTVIHERTRSSMVIEEDDSAAGHAAPRALPPAPRFLLRSLGGLLAAAFLLLLAAAAYLYWGPGKKSGSPSAVSDVKSIAVLPFRPLSGEPAPDDVLGLGMTDALITKLGSLRQIAVRSTSAVRKYARPRQDPLAAGRELAVDAVLDGSIQRSGERIRVTVQLLRLRDATTLWSGQFDERFTDIFAVQDSISQQVAAALTPQLTSHDRQRLAKHYTEDTEAFQLYLMGRFSWNKRTPEGFKKAIDYFNQAIEKDPLYALAFAGLADCYNILNNYDVVPATESGPRAKAAAQRALELDDSLAEAHNALALALEAYDYDQPGAERSYRRAIELNPNYATAHHWYGLYLVQMGRPEEALAELGRAQALDPLSPIINVGVAWAHYFARDYDRAIAHARKTMEFTPDFWALHLVLGWAYEQKSQVTQARAEFQRAVELSGGSTLALTSLGHLHAVAGRRNDALKILNELKTLSRSRYIAPFFLAAIHAGLGEKERALEWLEKAYAERAYWLISIKVNPWMDPLRSDSRFSALERRIGFPIAPPAPPAKSP